MRLSPEAALLNRSWTVMRAGFRGWIAELRRRPSRTLAVCSGETSLSRPSLLAGLRRSLPHRQPISALPIRRRRRVVPTVRHLEPRIVLDASAAIVMSELVISGSPGDQADVVNVEVDDAGNLTLSDGGGNPIEIATVDGAGDPTTVSLVAASELTGINVDLGGGDDELNLQIATGLDITVLDSDTAGGDVTTISFSSAGAAPAANQINISSDTIQFATTATSFNATDDTLNLVADQVAIGKAGDKSELDLGSGSLQVTGVVVLSGDVIVTTSNGPIDFSSAVLTATSAGHDLEIEAGASSTVSLGTADASGGAVIADLSVNRAAEVQLVADSFTVSGTFELADVAGTINIAPETAGSTVDLSAGSIEFNASSVVWSSVDVTTTTGDIEIAGASTFEGDGIFDSGRSLTFTAEIIGGPTTPSLRLEANNNVTLSTSVTGILDLDVLAGGTIDTNGANIDPNGVVTLAGDVVLISGDVTATLLTVDARVLTTTARLQADAVELTAMEMTIGESVLAIAGTLKLQGGTSLIVNNSALLAVGSGSIEINGGGGSIDLGDATLSSTAAGNAITINRASTLRLGNIDAANVDLQLGTATAIGGAITQATGTVIEVRQLNVVAGDEVSLNGASNVIPLVDSIMAGGDVAIVTSSGLLVGLINAPTATVTLNAQAINDADNDLIIDITADRLLMNAQTGIGNTDVLELAVSRLSGSTTSGEITLTLDGSGPTEIDELTTAAGNIFVTQGGSQALAVGRVAASGFVEFVNENGSITVADDGTATAGIAASNVTLTANSLRVFDDITVDSGTLRLTSVGASATQTTIRAGDNARLDVGSGIIRIDAGGGRVNMGNSTLLASGAGDVIRIDNASEITLGNIVAPAADLPLGTIAMPVSGPINQTPNTSIQVATLNIVSASSVQLGNANNQIALIESITSAGDVAVSSTIDLAIGRIDAGPSVVTLAGRTINDASADSLIDITAGELELNAVDGVGNTAVLEVDGVTVLRGSTVTGGYRLFVAASAPTTIEQLSAGGGTIEILQTGNQLLTIQSIENQSGDVSITNQSAGIVVAAGAAPAIELGGDGSLTLRAPGLLSELTIAGSIVTENGNVSLLADLSVGNLGGRIVMTDPAAIRSQNGIIQLNADGDVIVSSLATGNASESAIVVTSRLGALIDGGDQGRDLIANNGGAVIETRAGIGSANALETQLGRLMGVVRGPGAIAISEADSLSIDSLMTFDGSITVIAGGTLIASRIVSANNSMMDDPDGLGTSPNRDIRLQATGGGSDIVVTSIDAAHGADVTLIASDDILDSDPADSNRIVADDLSLTANNTAADGDDAISLSTAVNDLVANVSGANRGDLEIREFDSLNLTTSDRNTDFDTISTSNGEIRIFANENLRIVDLDGGINDGPERDGDPEVVAGGLNGRIEIAAGAGLIATDGVQLWASQTTEAAVTLAGTDVTLGDGFEINTGNGVGVARELGPRPGPGLRGTAFYEYGSIQTTILTQSGVNDATGTFSVLVGGEGERGLTLNIDWGAPTERFEQFDDLAGDARFEQTHIYTQQDILNSRLNGRVSATDSLNVRFSVRQHESILVTGQTIRQAGGVRDTVPGELLSSTDDPSFEGLNGPIFENGAAAFFIPNLEFPVAFFPERIVLPVPLEPELAIPVPDPVVLLDASLESSAAAAPSLAARDEFLQLVSLSPDPEGEDLAPPLRLPDDILTGDQLSQLFAKLPDGQYEIQYVLGDGNERAILRVDLRDGRPIVIGDDLEAGTLRLVPLEPDAFAEPPTSTDGNEAVETSGQEPQPESEDAAAADPDGTAGDELFSAVVPPSSSLEATLKDADRRSSASVPVGPIGLAATALGFCPLNRFSRAGRFSARYRSIR